jgi:hypothetical protein
MLVKLTMHDIHDFAKLFILVDKCARATEDRAWQTSPTLEAGKDSKPNVGATAHGGGN